MTIVAPLLVAAALYAWGWTRVCAAGRSFSPFATFSFALALVTIGIVLGEPVDALADGSLPWHMIQHLALISFAAPLLLLGAPHRLALAALPPRYARTLARALSSAPLRVLEHPVFGFLLLTTVLYGTHFSPFYEAALENDGLHAVEHALYLTAALIYWAPIFAVAPAPHAAPHPVRILSLFLSLPMSAFLGFALYTTNRVLYLHYARNPNALLDQMNGGEVMWLAGGTPVIAVLLWCVADWGAHERRLGQVLDATLDAQRDR
jgi:cytochrome c oxidase assembly factor CtaG